MHQSQIILLAMAGWTMLTNPLRAQDTNAYMVVPPTILETVENTTGQLIVKGTALIGTMNTDGAVISVVCKEDLVVSTGHKEHGILLGIKTADQPEDRTIIDFDELDALINSLDYLSKVNWSVTSLTSFDAVHTTKGGLRFMAFSSKRTEQIEFGLRSSRMPKRIALVPNQVLMLRSLIDQARKKLDALRNG